VPTLDHCHPQVVHALETEGWVVATKPFSLEVTKKHVVHMDIKAQSSAEIAPETIIIVEVRCFPDTSASTDALYTAAGQYIIYRSLLRQKGYDYPLYLAVPNQAFRGVFRRMAMAAVSENEIKMIVVYLEKEVIEQWLP
jgi:XisH protein